MPKANLMLALKSKKFKRDDDPGNDEYEKEDADVEESSAEEKLMQAFQSAKTSKAKLEALKGLMELLN